MLLSLYENIFLFDWVITGLTVGWICYSLKLFYDYDGNNNDDDDKKKKNKKIVKRWFYVTAIFIISFSILYYVNDYKSYVDLIKLIENPVTDVELGKFNLNYINYENLSQYTDEQLVEFASLVDDDDKFNQLLDEYNSRRKYKD